MESEKVKEIKECLEELKDDRIGYYTNGIARFMLTKEDVLTLINELENENERLQLENRVLLGKEIVKKEMHENLVMKNINIQESIKQENERLKNYIATLEYRVYAKEIYYNAFKDRALKQFAEKLKEKFDEKKHFLVAVSSVHKHIDETLKELQEE